MVFFKVLRFIYKWAFVICICLATLIWVKGQDTMFIIMFISAGVVFMVWYLLILGLENLYYKIKNRRHS